MVGLISEFPVNAKSCYYSCLLARACFCYEELRVRVTKPLASFKPSLESASKCAGQLHRIYFTTGSR